MTGLDSDSARVLMQTLASQAETIRLQAQTIERLTSPLDEVTPVDEGAEPAVATYLDGSRKR